MNPAAISCFTAFRQPTDHLPLPEKFTFPFYYEPHPLCLLAAEELQRHLELQTEWEHNFGIDKERQEGAIGKMFGVLVVRDPAGQLGYLSAFSGKLANGNHHKGFVPPVFDILTEDGFFRKGEEVISAINRRIDVLESSPELAEAQRELAAETRLSLEQLAEQRQAMKDAKREREWCREAASDVLSPEEFAELGKTLAEESMRGKFLLKDMTKYWDYRLADLRGKVAALVDEINALKEERAARSNALQQQLFDHYHFLNIRGELKSLVDIFASFSDVPPTAGTGECAAPKLLQYAFRNNLQPIAMAEFWWGKSPKSEVRIHGHFYPACRGKCEPILGHMLKGMEVDENPMLTNPAEGKDIAIVYEDEHIAVVNKPAEFLSVPGKNIHDSVYERVRLKYPDATGPLMVHRLDMSTSGLLLIAKTREVHKGLQRQFIKRYVKKRYVALLEGIVAGDSGTIDLPLRVDLDNRPSQLVCFEHGKPARTRWEVIERANGRTKVYFYPITGRTHQLRVHAAHPMGLNVPIVGDDLYGVKADRLHLHAETLEFRHPVTKEMLVLQVEAGF